MVRFEKVDLDRSFLYFGYSIEEIEKQEFVKVSIIDIKNNLFLNIYKKYTEELEKQLQKLEQCSNFDDYLFIIYNRGKLKFDFDLSR